MSERDMRKLIELIARRIGLEYADVTNWLRDTNSLGEIENRIARGSFAEAVMNTDAAALRIASEIHESYVTSGQTAARWLDEKIQDKLIRFDATAPQIVLRAKTNELDLVRGFQEERNQIARQITQRAIVEGAQTGVNPRRVAQDFRDSIGLTPQQEAWVSSYRRSLEQGDYLGAAARELSNGQADRTLRVAARDEKRLTPAQVDDYVERYRQNALTYRAETIARTEALRNANDGVSDAVGQAIQRGDVAADDLVKTWHAGPLTRYARPLHQQMDDVSVAYGENFVLPDGTRMSRPGDPRGGAKNDVNCRCTMSTSFK